jgi:hypothetical protein
MSLALRRLFPGRLTHPAATRTLRRAAAATLLALTAACERAREQPRVDTVTAVTLPPTDTATTPPLPTSAWDTTAGSVLLVRGDSPGDAQVVFPQYADSTLPDTVRLDPAPIRGATLDVFGRRGLLGRARITGAQAREWTGDGCFEWPAATMAPAAGDTASLPQWTVAFIGGRAQPIALDSIEALPRADSARLAVELTRLASALPTDAASPFRGLPFLVRSAYRFAPAPGVSAVAAEVMRKLNLEANPLEEHTLLVAERDSADARASFRTVYSERTAGHEERVATTEILAAVSLGSPRRAALVLARAGDESLAYLLLERGGAGRWQVRWASVAAGC